MPSSNIIKTIRYLTYAIVILIPLIYFPTGIFPFQVVKVVLLQSLVEIIFALWLGLTIFNKEYRPKLTPLTIALFAFMAIISLSVVFGSDWRAGLWSDESRTLGLIGLLHFFALFLVLSSLREKINWKKLFFLSFGTSVLVSLIGISQRFIVFPKGSNTWLYILYPGVPERIGSTFSNSSFMASYLLFNFFIGLWLLTSQIANRKSQIIKDIKFWFLGIGAILIAVAIFLSQTIGVILGLGAGIFVLLIYFSIIQFKEVQPPMRRLNPQKFSIGLLILILIFSGIFWFSRSASFWQKIPGLSRIAQTSFENESIRGRLVTWRISWEAFKERPLLGWGLENFRTAFNRYYDPKILTKNLSGTHWDKPHNVLLEYLTTTGIFGLLAYLGIFIAAFYLLFKKQLNYVPMKSGQISTELRAEGANYAKPIVAALLISYFIQNLFIFDTIGTYLMFFLVLAFIDCQGDKNFTEEQFSSNGNLRQRIVFASLLLLGLIPVYYNYQIFSASRHEYWGINYFLNQLPENSLVAFSRAVATPTPYRDDIRKSFANVVKQGYQQGIDYPSLSELQGNLAEYLKLVINRHPNDFFNYITLAEFENVFYKYNQNYLKEAEGLVQKALKLSPKRQQVYYVLAKTKLLEGDTYAAYKIFEEVINLNPQAADPHFLFGLMAYGIGDYQKGAEEIAKAERLGRVAQTPEEQVTLGNFIGDYHYDYKKAIEFYKAALYAYNQLSRVNPILKSNVLLKLAVAYYFDGDYEQSRQAFLELKKSVDLKQLPIYPDLQPVLQELGIN